MILTILIIWLALSAIAPYFHFPIPFFEIVLSYPPRLVYCIVCILLAFRFCFIKKSTVRFLMVGLLAFIFYSQMGIGGGHKQLPEKYYTLMSLNFHDDLDYVEELNQITIDHKVDFILLQEIHQPNWDYLADALPDYEFFGQSNQKKFEHNEPWAFSLLIGIKKEILKESSSPIVHTAITGYRTFALSLTLGGKAFQVVNAHITKPISIHKGLLGSLQRFFYKIQWHQEEGAALKKWTNQKIHEPLILAGDFNAPHYSQLIFPNELSNAHLETGEGVHLTFPRYFPVLGTDQTWGSHHIEFLQYQILDLPFSDHKAQLVHFVVGE